MGQAWDHAAALAALEWQVAMGADEAILDAPVDRFSLPQTAPRRAAEARVAAPHPGPLPQGEREAGPDARGQAAGCRDLPTLAQAMRDVATPLRDGARSFVFADGRPGSRVMIVGEAPGREEDIAGRPFVGPAGQLLDRMLAAIGLDRAAADAARTVYIANVLPWRPPGNRTPEPAEIALFLPWLERHIALAAPEVLVLMGNTPCQALLGRGAITRIRGQWTRALDLPVLPMFHPAYLLRNPAAKREAWADLLELKARLG
jgi:uracil-DNA glycosylase family 4